MREYNLKLSIEQLQIISAALSNMPFGQVVGLVNEINKQIQEQDKIIP